MFFFCTHGSFRSLPLSGRAFSSRVNANACVWSPSNDCPFYSPLEACQVARGTWSGAPQQMENHPFLCWIASSSQKFGQNHRMCHIIFISKFIMWESDAKTVAHSLPLVVRCSICLSNGERHALPHPTTRCSDSEWSVRVMGVCCVCCVWRHRVNYVLSGDIRMPKS